MYTGMMVALLGAIGLYSMVKAHFAVTRQVAGVLLAMAGVELFLAGVLEAGMVPALTAILTVLRLAAAGIGVAALRADRRSWRQREQRRRSYARQMRCAEHPLHALPSAARKGCGVTCA